MGNIVLLDELTINKIAAGEVIERPASVVKEMVENSIDAGAKHIIVEIKNGGISFIRITDDGKGIQKDDVEIAFERHATSKIRSADDLQNVKSMGFRGEALASIAAISNVELVSKQETDEIGTRIVVEGGKTISLDEIGCSKGTTITVRNLFFNTPVRYKFLKRDFTESGYIEDVVTRIALIHPEISIKFINTGKTILSTNGSGNIVDTIYNIFGKETANSLINIDYEYENMKVKGVIGKPDIARGNRSNQIFFVNSRYVKDKTLSSAAEQAFKNTLPFGKFPFLVLNVEMPTSMVDVNVHPAKLEVRFSEEGNVFKAMYNAIKDGLLRIDEPSTNTSVNENQIKLDTFETPKAFESFKIEDHTVSAAEIKPEITSPTSSETKFDFSNGDIFNKLKSLQDELKKETENNPNIKLTDEYKQMTEKYSYPSTTENPPAPTESEIIEDHKSSEADVANATIEEFSTAPVINEDIEQNQIQEADFSSTVDTQLSENDITNENIEDEKFETLPQENDNEIKNDDLSFRKMYKELFGKEPYGGRIVEEQTPKTQENFYTINDEDFSQDNISMFENTEQYNKPSYKFIGTAFESYIIIEMDNELYIMDQKLANEKIMCEKIKNIFYNFGEKVSQMLLLPDIISLDTKQMNIAKDNFKLFEKAGFTLEEFGENTMKLSGVPEICVDLDTENLFKEILEEINQAPRTNELQKEEKFIDAISSRVASKMPVVTSNEEIENLIDELLNLQNPFVDNYGKPFVIKMSRYEIEKKFARK